MSRRTQDCSGLHCPKCDKETIGAAVKCNQCKLAYHAQCTALPDYALLNYFYTLVQYCCKQCVQANMDNKHGGFTSNLQWLSETPDMLHPKSSTGPSTQCPPAEDTALDTPEGSIANGADDREEAPETTTGNGHGAPTPQPATETSQIDSTAVARMKAVMAAESRQTNASQPHRCQQDMRRNSNASQPHPRQKEIGGNNNEKKSANTGKVDKICLFYRKNKCRHGMKGAECRFYHPAKCPKYISHGSRGPHGCTKGEDCSFFHPTLCRFSLKKKECFDENCKYQHLKGTQRKPTHRPQNERNGSEMHTQPSRPVTVQGQTASMAGYNKAGQETQTRWGPNTARQQPIQPTGTHNTASNDSDFLFKLQGLEYKLDMLMKMMNPNPSIIRSWPPLTPPHVL